MEKNGLGHNQLASTMVNHTGLGDKKKAKKLNEHLNSSEHIWHLDGMTMRQKRDYAVSKIVQAPI